MTKPYSPDLRRRVVRLMAGYPATGCLAAKPEGGWRCSKVDPHRVFLLQRVVGKRRRDGFTLHSQTSNPVNPSRLRTPRRRRLSIVTHKDAPPRVLGQRGSEEGSEKPG